MFEAAIDNSLLDTLLTANMCVEERPIRTGGTKPSSIMKVPRVVDAMAWLTPASLAKRVISVARLDA